MKGNISFNYVDDNLKLYLQDTNVKKIHDIVYFYSKGEIFMLQNKKHNSKYFI